MSAIDLTELIGKARVLHEALPYIQDFRGSIFVVKYGGSFMDDPDPTMRRRVATDIAFLAAAGIHVVVVHGGGKAISRAMDSHSPRTAARSAASSTTRPAYMTATRSAISPVIFSGPLIGAVVPSFCASLARSAAAPSSPSRCWCPRQWLGYL